MNLNKALIIGNLTKDPELKALPSGNKVATFTLATNRYYISEGEKKDSVEFHNIVAFGKIAETLSVYCKKGDNLFVEGRIQTRSWEHDGVKHYRTEIIVDNFQFGQKAKREEAVIETDSKTSPSEDYPDGINIEDIPF